MRDSKYNTCFFICMDFKFEKPIIFFSVNQSQKTHFECTGYWGREDSGKSVHVRCERQGKCTRVRNWKRSESRNAMGKGWL